jgi:hypothetical protein
MTIDASLPPLYAAWIDDLLGAPIPTETNATCDSCAMVVPDNAAGDTGYSPATKCCTFVPELWNFLVGGVLLDEHADAVRGRATVEGRIDRGVAVTPLGLGRPSTYKLLYDGSPQSFGQSRALLCPHYLPEEGGLCGVWRHRESTCTTFFCKFVRGAVGKDFWEHLHQLLRAAEESVAAWCLLELGVDHGVLARLFRPDRQRQAVRMTGQDMDGEPNAADLRIVWGKWRGREREFYRECARLVAPLTWADIVRIGGAELTVYARLTQVAHARLISDAIPEQPVTALVQITPRGPSRIRLATYSGMDALEVPAVVGAILPYFDGRPTAEALADIRRTEGVNVDPKLVRKLTDFGVLRDATTSGAL